MSDLKVDQKTMSRRNFFSKAGILTAGLVATGAVGLSGIANADTATSATGTSPLILPLKYNKLDVEAAYKLGYDGYYKSACCYGAAYALLTLLHESAPDAGWNLIPPGMFTYGQGGGLGWGTLCGALNSSLSILNMASKDYSTLGGELLGWYTQFSFPSNQHEGYCTIKNQVTTVADSPLCHISVSKWSAAAGGKGNNSGINQAGKKERCAKVTGDVAAKTAELLNKALDGTFAASYKTPDTYASCMHCHNGKDSMRDDEQGKMDCNSCHTNL